MLWVMSKVSTGRSKKKPTLHIPHAALHSSLVAITWLAWQSMPVVEYVSISPAFGLREREGAYTDPWCGFYRWHSCRQRCLRSLRISARPLQWTKRPHPTPKGKQHSTIYSIDRSEYEEFLGFNNSSAFTFLTSKRAFPLSLPSFKFFPLVLGSSSTSISSAMAFYSIIRIE